MNAKAQLAKAVPSAFAVQDVLSDGSVAWNVKAELEYDADALFGCRDQAQAEMLTELLNDVCWVQVTCERGE